MGFRVGELVGANIVGLPVVGSSLSSGSLGEAEGLSEMVGLPGLIVVGLP